MKTVSVFLSFVFCFCALYGALSQIAGGAQEPAIFFGSTPDSSPQRFVNIPQTIEREWERLGSTFTLETWVWMATPPSSPSGNWTGAEDEMQFLALVSRHPGNNAQNEWAHFHLQLTRTTHGTTVVFWSGCGCEGMLNAANTDPDTCGFGYLLSSDSSKIAPINRFILKPEQWHHVSVTVDGDSVTQGFTSGTARLFIDGQLLLENKWGSNENIPPYLSSNPCQGRQIYSRTNLGTWNEAITLGYYDNSDVDANSENNTDHVFGFDGYLDELRIWEIARTPSQIASSYDLYLPPQGGLVGLYTFNGFVMEATYPNLASFEGAPYAYVAGALDDDSLVRPNNGLIISQLVIVPGTLPLQDDPSMAEYSLAGSSAQGYFISMFSDALDQAISSGVVELMDGLGNPIEPDMLPFEVGIEMLSMVWHCNDTECSNIPGAPTDVWFSYSSIEEPLTFSTVYFNLIPSCFEAFDACGVCGGDNRTCQCVIYHDFRNTRMAYILLTWSLEKIVEKIDTTIHILEQIEDIVQSPDFNFEIIEGNYTLAHQVSYMMDFYNLCLTDYCADTTEFIETLDWYLVSLLPKGPPPVQNNKNVRSPKSAYTSLSV